MDRKNEKRGRGEGVRDDRYEQEKKDKIGKKDEED